MSECEYRDKSVLPCVYYIKDGFCKLEARYLCIEARKRKAPRISHSEVTTYTKCYRMHHLSYIQGVERIKPNVRMLAGRIFGECLDSLFSSTPKGTWQGVVERYKGIYGTEEGEVPKEIWAIEGVVKAISEMPIAEEKGITQFEFRWKDLDYPEIHGFLDWVRLDADGVPRIGKEFKYSTNADWSKFIVTPQVSTYLLGVPTIERIDHVVFLVPGLKWITKGKNVETGDEYRDRVYNDVRNNPKEYVNRQSYWKNEFNLEDTKERYRVICAELYDRLEKGESAFYMTDNREVCFRCDYLEVCSNGGIVSEQLYRKREIKK